MEMGKASVGICDIMIYCFQLHYDHQVLLDYLISKDTGTDCAEYLLRCVFKLFSSYSSLFTYLRNIKLQRMTIIWHLIC